MSKKTVLFIASAALFILFIFFSYLVAKERFTSFDFNTTVKMQDHISRRWDTPFSVFSVLGSIEVTTIIWGCLGIYCLIKKYWLTSMSLSLFVFALMIEFIWQTICISPWSTIFVLSWPISSTYLSK